MLLRVSVDSQEDFDAWVRAQNQLANQAPKETAGRRAYLKPLPA